jgi:sodium pump decarboxylase gamma subunit
MIKEGLELMFVGMGVVFAFLSFLVLYMSLSGRFFTRFSHLFPDSGPPESAGESDQAAERRAVALAAAYRAHAGSRKPKEHC